MMTPPFQCGTLREPVTILCVGIATEDGCFLSGLHHRFELGHLYPNDEIAQATELSPVCLATDLDYNGLGEEPGVEGTKPRAVGSDTRCISSGVSSQYAAAPAAARSSDDGDDFEDDDDDGFSTSSCDEDDEDDSSTPQCECLFQGVAEKLATMDEDEPRRVCRGRIGPGAWHCYTAVFDGTDSLLRVDGVAEPVSFGMVPEDTSLPQPSAYSSFSSDNTPAAAAAAATSSSRPAGRFDDWIGSFVWHVALLWQRFGWGRRRSDCGTGCLFRATGSVGPAGSGTANDAKARHNSMGDDDVSARSATTVFFVIIG